MKNVLYFTLLSLLLFSCSPSPTVRSYIKSNEKAKCNFPLTFKSSLKWEVFPDSVKTSFNAFDKKLNKWVDNYVYTKTIYHTFTSKNAFGVPTEHRSRTIQHKDGKLYFDGIF